MRWFYLGSLFKTGYRNLFAFLLAWLVQSRLLGLTVSLGQLIHIQP